MASQDDTRRFYEYVWPLRATVLRTALFLCRNQAEADDVAQETLLKAYRAMSQYQENTSCQAWLMTILRHTRIDRLRSHTKEQGNVSLDNGALDVPAPEGGANPDRSADWNDPENLLEQFSDQQMIDALRALPEEIRWTLLLVDIEQLDQVQAAEILGVPVGTIKSRAHRGRAMMREALMDTAKRLKLV